MSENQVGKLYANLVSRALAFVIDSLVLACLCALLILFGREYFVQLGDMALWATAPIVILYYAVMDSAITKGRSIGRKICKISLMSTDGLYLPMRKAFVRAALFYLLFVAPDVAVPPEMGGGYHLIADAFDYSFDALAVASLYLMLFNWPSRQTIYDIVTGSVVLKKEVETKVIDSPVLKKKHSVVCVFILILSCSFLVLGYLKGGNQTDPIVADQDIQTYERLLEENEHIYKADAIRKLLLSSDGNKIYLSLEMSVPMAVIKDPKLRKEVLRYVMTTLGSDQVFAGISVDHKGLHVEENELLSGVIIKFTNNVNLGYLHLMQAYNRKYDFDEYAQP